MFDMSITTYQAYARNKLIAEAFYLTGDIEKYGSGFRRIRNEVDSQGKNACGADGASWLDHIP